MFCINCGTENEDTSLYCRECGAPLQDQQNYVYPERGYDHPEYPDRPPYDNYPYEPPYMETEQPEYYSVPKKKTVPKMAFVIGAEALAAICLIFASCWIMQKKYSAETTALAYWEAAAECDWSTAYEYCEFPNSKLLTKQAFVNAHASDTGGIDYSEAEVVNAGEVVSESIRQYAGALGDIDELLGVDSSALADQASDALDFAAGNTCVVIYREVGSADPEYSYITLSKTGEKQFLFWDEWKVTSSNLYTKDVTLNVPAEAEVFLNSKAVPEEYESSDGNDTGRKNIIFPYLFTGEYQVEVNESGTESYRYLMHVSESGADPDYIDLAPVSGTVEQLCEQAGADIKKILEAALDGKKFSKIEDLFSEDAVKEGDVKDAYEELVDKLEGNGSTSGVITLFLKNMTVSEKYSSVQSIELEITADRNVTYRGSYNNGSDTGSISMNAAYISEDASWKLSNLPITARMIY